MTEELHIQLKNGSKAAYRYLFDHYFKGLCSYAFHYIKDPDASKDIVQEVFFRLYERHDKLKIPVHVKDYLYRAIQNACINYNKHKEIKQEFIEEAFNEDLYGADNENAGNYYEMIEKVSECIENLPEKTRIIFKMNRFEKFKYAEIAEKLNISAKTVEYHMSNALDIINNSLKKISID